MFEEIFFSFLQEWNSNFSDYLRLYFRRMMLIFLFVWQCWWKRMWIVVHLSHDSLLCCCCKWWDSPLGSSQHQYHPQSSLVSGAKCGAPSNGKNRVLHCDFFRGFCTNGTCFLSLWAAEHSSTQQSRMAEDSGSSEEMIWSLYPAEMKISLETFPPSFLLCSF